jgi:NhaP-type Na+/H+ or K+/H+ antiporter
MPLFKRELSAGGSGCEYEHTGGAVVLAAPMASLLIGAFVAHMSSRFLPSLPYTPTLAFIGIIVAVIALQQDECAHMRGSVETWITIDGHALLFTFLPPLLFSDTMHADWPLFKASLAQCMVLASTGVLMGALLHAFYAMALPYDWSFTLSLAFGAVQAATDPVAVVSLLSALGAPATLTAIISGESLLNDGTAIVVWSAPQALNPPSHLPRTRCRA